MIRTIHAFQKDDVGDWVAELSCWHRQHVRHEPPFSERPWVVTAEGRAGRVGAEIECPLCDRSELPDGLGVVRTAGPFDEATLPAGLRREHRVADGTWGVLRVLDGDVELELTTDRCHTIGLSRGDRQAIPPGARHRLTLGGRACVAVDFLVATPA